MYVCSIVIKVLTISYKISFVKKLMRYRFKLNQYYINQSINFPNKNAFILNINNNRIIRYNCIITITIVVKWMCVFINQLFIDSKECQI